MRKLTKGFLIAAVVLILFGLALCAGGAAVGGASAARRTVRDVMETKDISISGEERRQVTDDETEGGSGHGNNYSDNVSDAIGESSFSTQNIRSLEIKIGKAEVKITENEALQEISVYTDGDKFDIDVKKDCLYIKSDSMQNENKVYIEIPADFEFEEVEISAGASSLEISRIVARSLDVEIGAGLVEIGEVLAQEAEFEIGAGEIIVNDGDVKECSVSVDLGEFQYSGAITREGDIECGMGNADIRLDGKEEDYNYKIECSAGNVDIGDTSYSGLAYEKVINNHAGAIIEVECSMGNVTIEF